MNRTTPWKTLVGVLGALYVELLRVLRRGMSFVWRHLLLVVDRIRMVFTQSPCHLPVIPGQGLFLLLPVLTQPIRRILLSLRFPRTQLGALSSLRRTWGGQERRDPSQSSQQSRGC